MAPHPHPLAPVDRIRAALDPGRRQRLGVRVLPEPDPRPKPLQEPHEHERDLVVRELLPEADARAPVERQEDEWVWNEVLLHTRVEEAVRVERQRWGQLRDVSASERELAGGRTVGAPEVLPAVHDEHGVQAARARRDVVVGLAGRHVLPPHRLDRAARVDRAGHRKRQHANGLCGAAASTDTGG